MNIKFIFYLVLFLFISGNLPSKDLTTKREAAPIVSKYRLIFNQPAVKIPYTFSVDAPLLGNGSFGIAVSGIPNEIIFYVARNDFWRLRSSYNESYPSVLGKLQLKIPQFEDAEYEVEQDLYTATTYLKFNMNGNNIIIKSYVFSDEDLFILELENRGGDSIQGELNLLTPGYETDGLPSTMKRGIDKHIQYISRQWDKEVDIKTIASCAMKMLGCSSPSFTIRENEKLYVVLSSSSNFKSNDCVNHTIERVTSIEQNEFAEFHALHQKWWDHYWNKSLVTINDPILEKAYYQSLYAIGSASRDLEFPPGIFGTWVTEERPDWNGDYHLNYNHQAPFYALFSSNRIEQALPYNYPLLEIAERTRARSKELFGFDGIFMPVGVGPKGIEVTYSGEGANKKQFYNDHGFLEGGGLYFFQKSNALHCINNMAMLCYYTYDPEYINLVYPFIKGVVDFWEGFLVFEDGRYVIHNDACSEGPNGDVNNIMTLGFLRNALQTVVDMSIELNVDADKRPVWKNIQDKLSKYPTYSKDGKTYYAGCEKGPFSTSHAGLWEIIFPGGQFHKDTDPAQLQIAKNSIEHDIETGYLWSHQLFSCFSFSVAARVDVNPDTIRTHLIDFVSTKFGENGFRNESPVGIETCSMVPGAINEMYLRSHPHIIEVFPVHNKKNSAYFQDLRAEGGFLVSSELKNQKVLFVKIFSEQGKTCTIVNPWDPGTILVSRNGAEQKIEVDKRFELNTEKGDIIIIKSL